MRDALQIKSNENANLARRNENNNYNNACICLAYTAVFQFYAYYNNIHSICDTKKLNDRHKDLINNINNHLNDKEYITHEDYNILRQDVKTLRITRHCSLYDDKLFSNNRYNQIIEKMDRVLPILRRAYENR